MRTCTFDINIKREVKCMPDSLKVGKYILKGGMKKENQTQKEYFEYEFISSYDGDMVVPSMKIFMQPEDVDYMYMKCMYDNNTICEKLIEYDCVVDTLNDFTKLLTKELYKEE